MENQQVEEKKPIYKKKWFLITISILVILILLPKNNDNKNQENEKVSEKKEIVISKSEGKNDKDNSTTDQNKVVKEKITSTIFSIEQAKDSYFSNFKGDRVFEGVKKFEDWVEVLTSGEKVEDKEIQKECKKLRNLIKDKQVKFFPLLRSNYVDFARGQLFDNDIEVTTSNRGKTTITFEGRTFMLNKNITDFQNKLSDLLSKLRFKKVEYRGYRGHDGYYYTLETPSDSELK